MLINNKIATIFNKTAIILDMKDDSRFRIVAYENAAEIIGNLNKDLDDIYREGGIKALKEVPGVGETIAAQIEEFIKTGKIKAYQQLLKEYPEKMLVLTDVPGIGPKTARVLYKELGIDSIVKLKKAAQSGLIQKLPHFKAQSEKNILRGIEQYQLGTKERHRMVLTTAGPIAEAIVSYIKKNPVVKKCDAVGSLRRMKETIGDIDIVVATAKAEEVIRYFSQAPFVKNILAQGKTKISVTHKEGVRIDLEILPQANYGSLLHHFTGSKEHNVALRTWAVDKKLKISEYGIEDLKKNKLHHFADEKIFFDFLGMQYIEPELREDRGEIELALKKQLPKIVGYNELRGDMHCHTNKSDGSNTIAEVAEKALKLKYKYLGISDHTSGLGVASGLTDNNLLKHRDDIYKVNKKYKSLRLLAGAEINIKSDGKLDIKKETLAKLDYSIGSVHSAFNQPESVMTKRILSSIKSGIKILGHPSGRLLGRRQPYDVEWEEVFKACSKYKVALEINSFPERLDLKDTLIKDALAYGCKFCINSDAHDLTHMDLIKYGLATARRGWATKGDIINSWELDKLVKWLGA